MGLPCATTCKRGVQEAVRVGWEESLKVGHICVQPWHGGTQREKMMVFDTQALHRVSIHSCQQQSNREPRAIYFQVQILQRSYSGKSGKVSFPEETNKKALPGETHQCNKLLFCISLSYLWWDSRASSNMRQLIL